MSFLYEQIPVLVVPWFVTWYVKFPPNSPIFQIRLAEKRKEGEEHSRLQSVMHV